MVKGKEILEMKIILFVWSASIFKVILFVAMPYLTENW